MPQVLVQGVAGGVAVFLARQVQRQQGAHLVQRHVHGAAQPHKAQAVHISRAVKSVTVVTPGAGRQQALFFVITDVGGRHARLPGGLANAVHCNVINHGA